MIRKVLLATLTIVSLSSGSSARHNAKSPQAVSVKAVSATVQIKMFAFTPKILTVTAGSTVTWTNVDDEPHTVTAVGGTFHSPALDTNDKFSFTFSKPGEYAYFCRLHPQMTAKVIVRPR